MRTQTMAAATAIALLALGLAAGQAQRGRLNKVIALLEQKKPVFGVYAPSAGGNRGRGAAAAGGTPPPPPGPPQPGGPPEEPPAPRARALPFHRRKESG